MVHNICIVQSLNWYFCHMILNVPLIQLLKDRIFGHFENIWVSIKLFSWWIYIRELALWKKLKACKIKQSAATRTIATNNIQIFKIPVLKYYRLHELDYVGKYDRTSFDWTIYWWHYFWNNSYVIISLYQMSLRIISKNVSNTIILTHMW